MKLCIVTHKVVKGDGQGRVNYEIVCEAMRRGHHVTLLAGNIAPDLQQSGQVRWVPILSAGWPTELLRNIIFAQRSADWLQKYRLEFDLVKVNGAITAARGDVNAVHFVHSSWLRSPSHTAQNRRDLYGLYQWFYTALNAHWEKQAFLQSKVVVAVSERVGKELIEIGIPQERIRVIVNGVDLHEFSPGISDRKVFALPDRVPLALFVGDIRTSRKNLDTVLRALAQVPDLHLAVVGATEGSPYPQMAAELSVRERVHFLGYRQDIALVMKTVNFLVFPSRYETFGLVVLEAMATQLPVITASTTGAAEIITVGCGVVLEDPNDTETLVQELKIMIMDPQRQEAMGRAARSIAEQYSWESMARRYVDLFEELAK